MSLKKFWEKVLSQKYTFALMRILKLSMHLKKWISQGLVSRKWAKMANTPLIML
jgi:hypothetical protein